MSLALLPDCLSVSVRDSGCTIVGVPALVRLGTALDLYGLPETQTHGLFSSTVSVSEWRWKDHLTAGFPLLRPRVECC